MQAEELRLFSRVYQTLSALFGEPPPGGGSAPAPESDRDLETEDVLDQGMSRVMAELGRIGQDPAQAAAAAADYERLFVGPGHLPAPPWESVYRTEERLLCGPPCLEVRAAYRAAGLEIDAGHAAPDDHISFELAFMGVLCERAAEALERGEDPDRWLAERAAFLHQHLLAWAPAFADDVRCYAETEFYRSLALWLSTWLDLEASTNGGRVAARV